MAKKLRTLQWITLAMAALAIATTLSLQLNDKPSDKANPYAGLGGDFTLTGAEGPVALSDFRGQVVVMMFGFTHCPDVCPTGLAQIGAAFNQLNEQQAPRVQGLFISVDPERDSPEHLAQYSRYFHPNIQGVTGSKPQVDAVVNAYGAFYRKVPLPDSELKYSVDHSSRIYLINSQGELAAMLYHNSSPAELAAAIKQLL